MSLGICQTDDNGIPAHFTILCNSTYIRAERIVGSLGDNMTLEEAIKARHSVRAYKAQPLTEDLVKVQERTTSNGHEDQTVAAIPFIHLWL
jgi:hypothetical protein